MSISPLTGMSSAPNVTTYDSSTTQTSTTGQGYSIAQQNMAINDASQAQANFVSNVDRQMVTMGDASLGNIVNTMA